MTIWVLIKNMGGGIKSIIRKNKKFSLKMLKSILVINTTIVWIKYRFDIDNVRTLPNVILSNFVKLTNQGSKRTFF